MGRLLPLQPQTREFGNASLELFKVLREVIEAPVKDLPRRHAFEAVRTLHRGLEDLGRFMTRSHEATRACLNSQLLFAPAKALPPSRARLADNLRGNFVAVTPADASELMAAVSKSAGAVNEAIRRRTPASEALVLGMR